MKLEQIQSPVNNHLLTDYWSENAKIHSFFEYKYNKKSFHERATYLQNKEYRSKQLAEIIREYMTPFGISEKVKQHLVDLQQGALVVVGGQQSGLLTGPLYSVHKAISVILLAKEQREKLNVPVVPMFWIAGEDHDLEEINHTYTIVDGEVKKRGYSERSKLKTMASTTSLNSEALEQFVKTVFKDYGETAYTEQLLADVLSHAKASTTFTDFFTSLMNELFNEHGLLLLDATFESFRQYEQPYFKALIENSEEIAQVVVTQETDLDKAGYTKPIEASAQNANIFYVKDGERFLLERKDGKFVNTLARVSFTKEELLKIAQETPQALSNNVVTRPLMQEMTIPVLAFVGGPGELAYWATLKPAFEILALQMPIFAPRLNITMVTRQVQSLLQQNELTVIEVMDNKAEQKLTEFIESVKDEKVQQYIDQMNEQLVEQYNELANYLEQGDYHLDAIIRKNKEFHQKQFNFLQSKIKQQDLQKHNVAIRQLKLLQSELYPNKGYQERVYSPYQYINDYGQALIDDLIALEMSISNQHQVVLL
ncbi:bacillithiol biosynthesis cysteine-adding enzyme BshC [Solibacillus sp. FSL R7-0682]|jgi:bacillithiol synthase|uniref:bacillithiol biosynthesis cysteine-adding enzyme BshC n=1 Tax=Solibacillus sp. FSL R7-0682 TaxID=2921690 RepID=UPI0030F63109